MSGEGDNSLGAWGSDIPLRVDMVADTWRRLAVDKRPWRAMPLDDAYGCWRRVLRELFNEAQDPHHSGRLARLVAAAHEHGTFRRRQQCGRESLSHEVDLLALAIEESLHWHGLSGGFIADLLVVLEPELRVVREGALTGWASDASHSRPRDEPLRQ